MPTILLAFKTEPASKSDGASVAAGFFAPFPSMVTGSGGNVRFWNAIAPSQLL